MKIDSQLYLFSFFTNFLFNIVSFYIFIICMFLEEKDIKYKQKNLFTHNLRRYG